MPHPIDVLEQMADRCEVYASDQRASKRWQQSKRARADCETRAGVYDGLAAELREEADKLKQPVTA